MLKINTKAPDFTLKNQNNTDVSLSDFAGKKVVLYFYAKDNTAGCTKQACGFSELVPLFSEENAVVIGISKDNVQSHQKFVEKYNLDIMLLSDPSLDILNMYEVYKEKNMYGKKVMGTVRTTYLINEEGIIIKAMEKVNAADNPKQMLDILKGENND